MKSPVTTAPEDLDFARLLREGDTVGWAEATAEPALLTRLLDRQAERCPPFRVFFALTFATDFRPDHPNVTVTALGGASAGRRFFAAGAANVIPANISGLCDLIAAGRPRIDVVLLQVTGPDPAGNYNAGDAAARERSGRGWRRAPRRIRSRKSGSRPRSRSG